MNHFDYSDGVLHAEAVNLSDLADAVGTPFYCYSTATLERHYRVFTEAFAGENGFASFIPTSANTGEGCDTLLEAIRQAIPWDELPKVTTEGPLAPLRAIVADTVCLHLVFANHMKGAVFQVQLEVCRPRSGREDQKRQQVLPHIPI